MNYSYLQIITAVSTVLFKYHHDAFGAPLTVAGY